MGTLLTFLAFIAAVAAAPFLLSLVVARITERANKERSKTIPPVLFSFYRLFAVAACYLLSGYGLAFSFTYVRLLTADFRYINPLVLVWTYAWACHAAMSLAWVINRKLSKLWPISGTLAAVASLFILPVTASIRSGVASIAGNSAFLLFEIIFVLPCLLLAIHLVRFHLGYLEKHPIPQTDV